MPKSLLLADDSVTIQKVVGISFANEDIEITTVDNGRDAVAKARAIRPDIILADVVMPGMSGYEVCETVKADPSLRHIPILLLTGTFEAFDQARATAVGAAGHVAKPFEAQTLVDRVKQLLASAASPAPRAAASLAQRAEGERSPSGGRPAAAPAAQTAARAPQTVAASDDAFDFFGDESSAPAPAAEPSADTFDLDGPDGAFAFGDDDLSGEIAPPLAPAKPAPMVAPRRAESMAPSAPMADARRPADATIAILPEAPPAQDDAFEFSFDRVPGRVAALDEPIDPDQLAHTTLLDPAAGSGLDISSSDLDDSRAPAASFAQRAQGSRSGPKASEDHRVSERRPAELTQILAMDDGPQSLPLAAEDAELDLAEAEPFDAPLADDGDDPFAADPFATTIAPLGARGLRAESREAAPHRAESERTVSGREAQYDPFEAESYDEAPVMVGEPIAIGDDFDDAAPLAAAPADDLDAEPWNDAPFAAPAAELVETASEAPSIGRAELRDAIEKIAWDALGPVTEKIVREAIARIEQVAWEVVPKLAETLIQEEIRRLKGDS